MCEKLSKKIHEVQEGYPVGNPFLYFEPNDIYSSVEGLIKYHEGNIENSIGIYNQSDEYYVLSEEDQYIINTILLDTIRKEFYDIMAIEHWLEDAIWKRI